MSTLAGGRAPTTARLKAILNFPRTFIPDTVFQPKKVASRVFPIRLNGGARGTPSRLYSSNVPVNHACAPVSHRVSPGGTVKRSSATLSRAKFTGLVKYYPNKIRLSRPERLAVHNAIRNQSAKLKVRLDRTTYNQERDNKMNSLYPSTSIHPQWRHNRSLLFSTKKSNGVPSEIWGLLDVEDRKTVASWVDGLRDSSGTISSPSIGWEALKITEAARRWPNIALWLLLYSPGDVPSFLEATGSSKSPPFCMVADCFVYLETFHRAETQLSAESRAQYCKAVAICLGPEKLPILERDQRGLNIYLKYCNYSEILDAYTNLSTSNKFLTMETALYFMGLFTHHGDIENALHVLRLIATRFESSAMLKSPRLFDGCCSLLTANQTSRQNSTPMHEVLPQLLELGIQPNLDMFNMIILDAVGNNDPELPWSMLRFIETQGMSPNSYTYVPLLDDSIRSNDPQKKSLITRKISKEHFVASEPHVTSKHMHAILSLAEDTKSIRRSVDCFQEMLEVYEISHDVQPLRDLGIVGSGGHSDDKTVLKRSPSAPALVLMITAYLRMRKDPDTVHRLFKRFREFVNIGHNCIAPLAETDYIFNAFLVAMRYDSRMLQLCIMVVESMLQPLPKTAVLKSQNNRPVQQVAPSERTWTILLDSLMSHQELESAGKVVRMMLDRGIKLNGVTWNVIIKGYANMQMVKEAVAALKMMERDNWEPDQFTVKALGSIQNQDLLRSLLREPDSDSDELPSERQILP
ncbi:hypothetical protein FQN57_000910 [Myotisia sp. PD_48]|nr:hypothetical protein FQN57_000910 [Myotisia sp. PD_48]